MAYFKEGNREKYNKMVKKKRLNRLREENVRLNAEIRNKEKNYEQQREELRTLRANIARLQADRDIASSRNIGNLLRNAAYQITEASERRKLVTVDGPNGAGKSTLLRDLGSAFTYAGFRYAITKESALCTLLEGARSMAKKNEGYAAPRDREQTIGSIVTAGRLIEGRTKLLARLLSSTDEGMLILDRYIWTTIAFQLGTGRSLDETIGLAYNSFIHPDASVILTCDPEVARLRAERRYLDTPAALDTGKQMEVLEELEEKTVSYRKFVDLMGEGYNGFKLKHYDTSEMSQADVALAVIKDVISKYVDENTRQRMEEHIRNKYTGNVQTKKLTSNTG